MSKPPTFDPTSNPDERITEDEVVEFKEYLASVGAPDTFVIMGLMTLNLAEVELLTKAQARKLMQDAESRYKETSG